MQIDEHSGTDTIQDDVNRTRRPRRDLRTRSSCASGHWVRLVARASCLRVSNAPSRKIPSAPVFSPLEKLRCERTQMLRRLGVDSGVRDSQDSGLGLSRK